MRAGEARQLGQKLCSLVQEADVPTAYAHLAPTLAKRTPFRLLDLIGDAVGAGPVDQVNAFLQHVAAQGTEGGWVIIGSSLRGQLSRDMPGALSRCQSYIIAADIWYGADILAERVSGPALLLEFGRALGLLSRWRADGNPWVRQAVGVAIHFWAKRTRGGPEHQTRALRLLRYLEPVFDERSMDAAKGIGWGLKTLGRYYPEQQSAWLAAQMAEGKHCRAVVLRKALTYLPEEARERVLRAKNDVPAQ